MLRNISAPAQKQLREQSFRHALCAAILQASLTDQEGTVPGCPDWNQVLNSLFTHAELENAARKPYAKANLPVLQRMLTMVENERLMTHYQMAQAYLDALVKTLHKNADWRAYQTSLARTRTMCELYRLQFTADGLDFLAGTDTE